MKQDRIEKYEAAYFADYGFERTSVHYRRKLLLDRLWHLNPEVVIEIGCGSELLISEWLSAGGTPRQWLIVEPGRNFAAIAENAGHSQVAVINDFFEAAIPQIRTALQRAPDLVICAGLLHEVPSSSELFGAIAQIMGPDTLLHVNVPNARSLHRRIAQKMGLIEDLKALSEQNAHFFQHRVYDMDSLRAEAAAAGLRPVEQGGYFVKPFTHAQMLEFSKSLDSRVMDGLYELGRDMPEIASEIYMELRK